MTGRDPDRPERPLSDLRARIARLRAREAQAKAGGRGRADLSGSGVVLRVGIELVGTLAVGVAIGWGLDRWLGTGPWLLVVFFFLGAAAGVLNVYRAVSPIGLAPGYRPDGDADRDADDEGPGGGTDEKR
jgi:ATP synthase protein I